MRKTLAFIALLAMTLGACGNAATAWGPPDIKYGRDICVQCGMIITEARFAAAYRLDDGTEKTFDDLGGLLLSQRSTDVALNPEHTWVHDFETEEWVVVTSAYFVATLSVSTPMGHSILAFIHEERAAAFASDVGGEVLRWNAVFAMPERNGVVGSHHMDMDTNSESKDHDHEG